MASHAPTLSTSAIRNKLQEVGEAVAPSVVSNKKIADLHRNIKDGNSKQTNTTDFGCPVADLDNWLRVSNDETNYVGPALLEDQIARERVGSDASRLPDHQLTILRFTDSTMSVSQNVSSTPVVPLLTGISSSSRVLRTSPLPKSCKILRVPHQSSFGSPPCKEAEAAQTPFEMCEGLP